MANLKTETELSSCGFCGQLSDEIRTIKVAYHVCSDCNIKDFEVVRKGSPRGHDPKPLDDLAVGGQADATPKIAYTPPPRQVPPGIANTFKPEGYTPL